MRFISMMKNTMMKEFISAFFSFLRAMKPKLKHTDAPNESPIPSNSVDSKSFHFIGLLSKATPIVQIEELIISCI